MIGMGLAILTTLAVTGGQRCFDMGVGPWRSWDRRHSWRRDGATHRDDRHAAIGGGVPLARRSRRGACCGGRALFARRLRYLCSRRRQYVHGNHQDTEPDRDEPGRRDRRHHLCRFDHRFRQTEREHVGRADSSARASSAQSSDRAPDRRACGLFRHRAGALDVLGDHGVVVHLRHHADHSHRRRGHAGGRLDAEFLFGLGGGGDRLHAGEYGAHHYGCAGWAPRAPSSPTSCARG